MVARHEVPGYDADSLVPEGRPKSLFSLKGMLASSAYGFQLGNRPSRTAPLPGGKTDRRKNWHRPLA
jgi:hypothetical protein